jgi:hypothetical protein
MVSNLIRWRATLNHTEVEYVCMRGTAVAERVEYCCECLECGDVCICSWFCVHASISHASQRGSEEGWKQCELRRWERWNDSLVREEGGQTRLFSITY